jgi:peptidoglycan hydrolase-like protein with peptidoglycan-binding domain
MRFALTGIIALGLLTAACGDKGEQRAATGGLSGAGVGALAGGPLGAAVGGAAGAAAGALMPEGVDKLAERLMGNGHKVASGSGSSGVKQAQIELQREGLYSGRIDGIAGPETRDAIIAFQQREGLKQTGTLDGATSARMNQIGAPAATAKANAGTDHTNSVGSTSGPTEPGASTGTSTSPDN